MNQFVEEYDSVLTELRSFQEGGIISRAAAREAVEARRGGAPASAPRGAFDAGSAVGYGSRRNLREEHRRIEEWEVAKEMLGRMRLSSIYEDKKVRTRAARRQQVVRWSQAQKDLAAAREVEKQQQRMLAQHASSATSSVASRSWPDDIDGLLANASRPPRPKSSNDNEMPSNEEYNRASASTSAEVAAPEQAMRPPLTAAAESAAAIAATAVATAVAAAAGATTGATAVATAARLPAGRTGRRPAVAAAATSTAAAGAAAVAAAVAAAAGQRVDIFARGHQWRRRRGRRRQV